MQRASIIATCLLADCEAAENGAGRERNDGCETTMEARKSRAAQEEPKKSQGGAKEEAARQTQQGKLHVSKHSGAAHCEAAANQEWIAATESLRGCACRAQQHCHELLQDVIGAAAWLAGPRGACNACCTSFADGGESAKERTVAEAGSVLDAPVGVAPVASDGRVPCIRSVEAVSPINAPATRSISLLPSAATDLNLGRNPEHTVIFIRALIEYQVRRTTEQTVIFISCCRRQLIFC